MNIHGKKNNKKRLQPAIIAGLSVIIAAIISGMFLLQSKSGSPTNSNTIEKEYSSNTINAYNSNIIDGDVTGDVNQTINMHKERSMYLNKAKIDWLTSYLLDNPSGYVQVAWSATDNEASILGPQLAQIFGKTEWKHKSIDTPNGNNNGISLIIGYAANNFESLHPSDAALVSGLINVGLTINISYDLSIHQDAVYLYVGNKQTEYVP